MATYILFWNPAISSYTMERFQDDFNNHGCVGNWSFHEHEDVEYGDIFYMVRCGEGKTGIVMRGKIDSECYESEDWSPKKRKPIYYADIEDGVTINPETASVMLTPELLTEKLPDFNWFGGHSGRKLSEEYADKLEEIWMEYINSNPKLFANDEAHINKYADDIISDEMMARLEKELPKHCEVCGYDYCKVFGEEVEKLYKLNITPTHVVGSSLPRLFFNICHNCCKVQDYILVEKLKK